MPRSRFSDEFVLSFMQRLIPELPPAHVRASVRGPCLVWSGAKSREGHGRLQHEGRDLYAHRVAWEIEHGREPGPLLRHLCGVHACCSSVHLMEGTPNENTADAVLHGTHVPPPHPCGAAHPSAKLPDGIRGRIHALIDKGYTQTEIAEELGVSQSLVSQILTGKTRTCKP